MSELPVYLWVLILAGVIAVAAETCFVLYGGAVRAGLGKRTAVLLTTSAAVLIGGWYIASALIGAAGDYRTVLGRQIPWLPIVVVAWAGLLLALSRIPVVRRAVSAPGMRSRLVLPHAARPIEGAAFLIAMFIGFLPPVFSIPAGLGDIAVGIAAPFVARKLAQGTRRRTAPWFHGLGIADLVTALTLGGLTGFGLIPGITSGTTISELPLVLVPTAAVPILFVLHIVSLTTRKRPQNTTAPSNETAGSLTSAR